MCNVVLVALFLILFTALTISGQSVGAEPESASPVVVQSPTSSSQERMPPGTPSPSVEPKRTFLISSWTTDTWTAIASIVAFVALIQPWLISLWRKVFRRGTIDIHEAAKIEIGYSNYGPTIGLVGTLRALHRDMFVRWAKLQLKDKTDESVREFEWRAYRNPKVSFGGKMGQSTEVLIDIPLGFTVSTLQSHPYNIVFSYERALEKAVPIAQQLHQEWLLRVQKLNLPSLDKDPLAQPRIMEKLRREFLNFSTTQTYKDAAALLNTLNSWRAGNYVLTIHLQTSRPDKVIVKTWTFTVPQEELNKLQANIPSILEDVCGLPLSAGEYAFGYVTYNS